VTTGTRADSGRAGGRSARKLFLLFLDGVGAGAEDPAVNPFFRFGAPGFARLCGGVLPSTRVSEASGPDSSFRSVDPVMGVPGLPQSGTGQTSLLTGVNAPRALGRHFGPWPHSEQRHLLESGNIFLRLAASGLRCGYANAFPRQYHEHVAAHPNRISAISYAWRASGGAYRGHAELSAGRALSADITGEAWSSRLGYKDLHAVTSAEAARNAVALLEDLDFLMLEYFLTDAVGHDCSFPRAAEILPVVDGFISGFIDAMDPATTAIALVSDHGNFEDLSVKTHTLNLVPFAAAGVGHAGLTGSAASLSDVAPAIERWFGTGKDAGR
jgi:hypothetical protein